MAASSSSSTTQYTKLRLDSSGEDYNLWKDPMLRLLESRSLSRFVDGSHPPPRKANSQAHREWRRNDGLVKNWIVDTLSDKLIPVVISGRTSRDVWVQLEAMFNPALHPSPPPLDAFQGESGKYTPMPLKLYKSALSGEWDATKEELDGDPSTAKARSFPTLNTVLHIAVGTGKAIPYLSRLVAHKAMTDETLAATDDKGRTALHVAAQIGNLVAARILVHKHPALLVMPDNFEHFPVLKAAKSRHRPTLKFFLEKTEDATPYTADNGVLLINTIIDNSFLDIALDLIERFPDLARRKHSSSGHSVLRTIALKSAAFPSGARFNRWEGLIYSCIELETEAKPRAYNPRGRTLIYRELGRRCCRFVLNRCDRVLYMLQGFDTKYIHDQKVMHDAVVKLVKSVCMHMEVLSETEAASIYVDAMLKAAELGVHEVIEEIVDTFPQAIYSMEINSRRCLFHMAVENRCEKVFNLIYQMSGFKYEFSSIRDNAGNTLLHKVAHLAPPHKLNLVSGAALQMQRELQWFQEVDEFVKVDDSERLNYEGRTPEMIFTEEHSELRVAGEKWMKDTASSCSVSAALITTVMFAAAVNVHRVSDDDYEQTFIVHEVSIGLSIFASSNSLLMFLSILISRCAEEDFLNSLPIRLLAGLVALYASIAFMMLAFTSAMMYLGRGHISLYLIFLITLLPYILGILQFPLLLDIISSTFGRGVFVGFKKEDATLITCNSVYGADSGDSCSIVAQAFGLSLQDFLTINPNINCDGIFVGQWLCLNAST